MAGISPVRPLWRFRASDFSKPPRSSFMCCVSRGPVALDKGRTLIFPSWLVALLVKRPHVSNSKTPEKKIKETCPSFMGNVPRKANGSGGQTPLAESQCLGDIELKETAEAGARERSLHKFQITICVLENEEILISELTPCPLRSPGLHQWNHVIT